MRVARYHDSTRLALMVSVFILCPAPQHAMKNTIDNAGDIVIENIIFRLINDL